jgi:hypothetical protein
LHVVNRITTEGISSSTFHKSRAGREVLNDTPETLDPNNRRHPDFGHCDYEMLEEIAKLELELEGRVAFPGLKLVSDFTDTGETFIFNKLSSITTCT